MPTQSAATPVSLFRKDHIPELDGLRGIAVLLVLWVHLPLGALGEGAAAFRAAFVPGNVGVDLFFVLSGFLITRILLVDRESKVPLRYFLIRRFLRIFPIYYLTILLAWPRLDGPEILAAATYTSNYAFILIEGSCALEHTWSLAVEEHFYLLWPPVVAFLSPVVSRRVLLLGVMPVAVLSCALALLLADFDAHEEALTQFFRRSSNVRFFSLGLGALMAYHETWIRSSTARAVGLMAGCVVICWAFSGGGLDRLGIHGFFAGLSGDASNPVYVTRAFLSFSIPFGSAAAVLFGIAWTGARTPLGFLLTLLPLRWMGRISYGIYLYHYPIFTAGLWGPEPITPSVVRVIAVLALCIGAAALSFYLIERPLLAIGSRFRGPRGPASAAVAPKGKPAVAGVPLVRLGLSAGFLWGLYALINGGAATVVGGIDRRFPREAPAPDAALAKARIAAPFILEWSEEWGTKLEGAAAAIQGSDVTRPPEFFVLGVAPTGADSMTGIFVAPTGEEPNTFCAFVDLTLFKDVARRVKVQAGLAPLYLLSAAVGARQAAIEASARATEDSDLRIALFGDWVAGAALRMVVADTSRDYSAKDIGKVVRAARAAEEVLQATRPIGWGKAATFRAGSAEQRTRWFLRGYQGTGAASEAWELPTSEL